MSEEQAPAADVPPAWHRPGKVGRKITRHPLTSPAGCIAEIARVYRHYKAGRIEPEVARTRVYVLDKLRAGLEAQALGELQERLDELEVRAGRASLGNGGGPLALPSH